nr:reverse transcriptase domain-containing protein [Tanacetum cinerariifolium]
MQTRSSSRIARDQSSNTTSSTNLKPKGRNRGRFKQRIVNSNLEEQFPPIVTMADQRTMAQLLQAPTEGYEDAIVVPTIVADNFELKHGLLTLVQNKQFYGLDKEDPHAHICYFNKITSTLKFLNVPNTSIKLMFFPFSLEGAAQIWLEKEPPRSILTWDDLVSKFINQFFPPSKTTSLHQDSLNSAAGGNFLDKMPCDCLSIIESKSKVRYSRDKPVVARVSTTASTSGVSPDVAELKDLVRALLLDKKGQTQSPALVKAVKESCVTCGVNYNQGNTGYRHQMMSNQIRPPGFPLVPNNQHVQQNNQNRFILNQNRGNNFNQGLIYQPMVFQQPAYQAPSYQAPTPQTQGVSKEDFSAYIKANDAVMKNMQTQAITARSGVSYDGPQIPPWVVENEPGTTKDTVNATNNGNTKDVQPQAVQSKLVTSKPTIASVSVSKPNPKASIPYPSRRNDERNREKAKDQIEKFYQIFKDMSFEISFADALILMPKSASTLKALIGNKEKLSEMARTPLNEHCSAVLLKKLPEKLGDPGKFLIPCDFPCMAECLALADLGASINLMPLHVWKKLSFPELTPTCMTLELADRLISHPVGVAEDVYVKVGSFHFPTDFVVVDFDADPRVPLILRRSFLKTRRSLIDVFKGELTLRVGKEAITFNLEQTSRYSANYSDITAKRIDVIDMACEEYSQEVLGFSDTISSGNPTLSYDLIVFATSPTLTSFENSDFLLEEIDVFLAVGDEPTLSQFQQSYLDPEGDILLLEAFLNDDPSSPLLIKDLSVEEKTALITVLKSHKRAIAWKLSDIKENMLKGCEDTNLCLNWEKNHFMVNEGIVLGHKISKQEIEVDKAKVDVISKLPHPTTAKECVDAFQTLKRKLTEAPILIASDWDMPFELMCDASDFAIGVALGQRQDKHFRPIHYASKTMTEAESKYTTTEKEMLAMVYAFEKFQSYLILNKSIVMDHSALKYLFVKKYSKARLLRWVFLLQEFTFKVVDTKGAENLAADHLSPSENPHQNVLDPKEINESFPLETLNQVSTRGNQSTPWFADFANHHAGNFIVKGMSS